MMTVILSLTGPIEHGQEERQAIEVGTGGVSTVGFDTSRHKRCNHAYLPS